ncbi:hypothetical protein CRYUN_Cryun15aG0098100 [Craigia yunnanensis]
MDTSKTSQFAIAEIEKEVKLDDGYQKTCKKFDEMLPTLPKGEGWWAEQLVQYQGFWLPSFCLRGNLLIHDHFKPRPTDIILSTSPKCGTTWLRALIFATINRNSYDFFNHPPLKANPQDLVFFFETYIHEGGSTSFIEGLPSPRFLSTHIPYSFFPKSMTSQDASTCHFIYICRDPKDVFVSKWHFFNRKLVEFLGVPFSPEEEKKEIVQEIVKLCSFENLANLDVNKDDTRNWEHPISSSDFFRKDQVGDWVNHLTPKMAEILDRITKEKFQESTRGCENGRWQHQVTLPGTYKKGSLY